MSSSPAATIRSVGCAPKQRLKSYTGCWTCRERKVKCDETKPECLNCTRRGRHCKGYHRILQWSRKANSKSTQPAPGLLHSVSGGRRARRYAGGPLLDLPQLAAGDLHKAIANTNSENVDGAGPFGAFQLALEYRGAGSITIEYPTDPRDNGFILDSGPVGIGKLKIQTSPLASRASNQEEAFLSPPLSTRPIENDTSDLVFPNGALLDPYLADSQGSTPLPGPEDQNQVEYQFVWDAIPADMGEINSRTDVDNLRPADPHRDEHLSADIDDDVQHEIRQADKSPEPVFPVLISALNTNSFLEGISPPQRQLCQEMIYHYSTKVAHMMTPVGLPQRNPWLTIFLPRAIAMDGPSSGRNALLHSLISTAAFNRARLAPSQSYEEAGKLHMQLAITSLRQALECYGQMANSEPEEINILASVLSMTTVEAFRGGQGAWGLHLQGARNFLKSSGGYSDWLRRNNASSALCQVFDCLDTLRATKGNCKPPRSRVGQEDDRSPEKMDFSAELNTSSTSDVPFRERALLEAGNYSLDVSYGISLPTLIDIKHINNLVDRLDMMNSSDNLPTDIEADMERISRSLYRFTNATDSSRLGPLFDADDGFMGLNRLSSVVAQEMMEHHCWAFHFAAILYFNRATYPFRRTMHREQEWLVAQVFDHLETLDSLNGDDGPPVTLWPALVAGCESRGSALRRRVISFFARHRRFGLANSEVAKKVILEVWRRTDRSGIEIEQASLGWGHQPIGSIDWREVMHDLGADIVLA